MTALVTSSESITECSNALRELTILRVDFSNGKPLPNLPPLLEKVAFVDCILSAQDFLSLLKKKELQDITVNSTTISVAKSNTRAASSGAFTWTKYSLALLECDSKTIEIALSTVSPKRLRIISPTDPQNSITLRISAATKHLLARDLHRFEIKAEAGTNLTDVYFDACTILGSESSGLRDHVAGVIVFDHCRYIGDAQTILDAKYEVSRDGGQKFSVFEINSDSMRSWLHR